MTKAPAKPKSAATQKSTAKAKPTTKAAPKKATSKTTSVNAPTTVKMPQQSTLADAQERDKAIKERVRDVVVIAGAGSGKTTLLAKRFAELVAPENDTAEPFDARKIAAVTFTRRAAGELRNRIKTHLLELQALPSISQIRKTRVDAALLSLDEIFAGTIHSFADRLLCCCPIEAGLPPNYDIEEENNGLLEAVHDILESATSVTTVKAYFLSNLPAPNDAEITKCLEWMKLLRAVGIEKTDYEGEHFKKHGWGSLFSAWLNNRERSAPQAVKHTIDINLLNANISALIQAINTAVQNAQAPSPGGRVLAGMVPALIEALNSSDIIPKANHLSRAILRHANIPVEDFSPSTSGQSELCNLYDLLKSKNAHFSATLGMFGNHVLAQAPDAYPVVLALYEHLKARTATLDQSDLLICLRDVLKTQPAALQRVSNKLDHIFVDEFQDTDPIQAEIFSLLAQNRKGFLTVIGDPKQSIYRFRRADISEFAKFVSTLRNKGAVEARLSVNFRSRPELISVFNAAFSNYMGTFSPEFDANTGAVSYSPLSPSPKISNSPTPPLHILSLTPPTHSKGHNADTGRNIEGVLLARHIAWMLSTKCPLRIRDKHTQQDRPIVAGDIAVLAKSLNDCDALLAPLRKFGIPVFRSGGTTFTASPLLQKFIRALKAIADSRDGAAQCLLWSLPFGAVAPAYVITDSKHPEGEAAANFQNLINLLRTKRFSQPVLHTALSVLENSLALRWFGVTAGGEEDIAALRRFAIVMANAATENGWDFDQACTWAEGWIENPPRMNSPFCEGDDSVSILTIHQAKGLEFPVVVLWDGYGYGRPQLREPFLSSVNGSEWELNLGDYVFSHTGGNTSTLSQLEKTQLGNEIKRLYYVAATRARDFLVVPVPFPTNNNRVYTKIFGDLFNGTSGNVLRLCPTDERYVAPEFLPLPKEQPITFAETAKAPTTHPAYTLKPQTYAWHSVTELAHNSDHEHIVESATTGARRRSRIERKVRADLYGTIVHRAMALHLGGNLPLEKAAWVAVLEHEDELQLSQSDLEALKTKVIEFGTGAIANLQKAGLMESHVTRECEVPFTWIRAENGESEIIRGCIDLICTDGDKVTIVDFKTDLSDGQGQIKPEYRHQIELYTQIFEKRNPTLVYEIGTILVGTSVLSLTPRHLHRS